MNPLLVPVLGSIIETVGKVADDLFTSDKERAQAALDAYNAETHRAELQTDINKVEAAHSSLFVAGWRPAVGWVGVAAMAYQFVLYPFLVWGWTAMQAAGWISPDLPAPPILATDALWIILTGILGIGGLRSFDKAKGTA
jgi:hypothetical protein